MNSSVAAGSERSNIQAPHPESLSLPRATPFRYICLGVLLCLVGVLGAGCIFSPDKGKTGKLPIVYPKRDTPQNAILFLQTAWENKDSVQIAAVYADDYAGSSVDLTDTTPKTLDFLKSDEIHALGWLARNQQINYLDMDFYSRDSWLEVRYASDPSDWVTLQIPHFKIEVRDVERNGYIANSETAGEIWFFEFTLKPTGPAAEPWQIVRWVESRAKP